MIFGNTGGVTEAALRTTYHFLTGKTLTHDAVKFDSVRGYGSVREATVTFGQTTIRAAVVYGTKEADAVLNDISAGRRHYDFMEVMTCPGGCIGGGGQPKFAYGTEDEGRRARIAALYARDEALTLRSSFENPEIVAAYEEFYGAPGSDFAKAMLHTEYVDRSADLGEANKNSDLTRSPSPEKSALKHRFRCKICGYVHEAESLPADFTCPLCSAPASEFEEIS